MHGHGDYLTKCSKPERERYTSYEDSIKSYRKELIYKTETDSQTYGQHRGKVEGKDKLGVWDWYIHITVFNINNQQGPTVKYR